MARQDLKACLPLFLASLLAMSCKPPATGSSTQSLDNMSRGSGDALVANDCSGPYAMTNADFDSLQTAGQIVVQDRTLVPALRRALSAVPPSLQRTYFGMGYKLLVSNQAAALCAKAKQSANPYLATDLTERDGTKEYLACWTHEIQTPSGGGTDGKVDEVIQTVIDAKAATIAHSTLRAVAYAVADRFAYMSSKDGRSLTMELDNENPGFVAARAALTIDALMDKAGQTGAFAYYRQLMPANLMAAPASSVAGLWKSWQQSNPAEARRFENALFAETMDSVYCSAASNAAMKSEFPTAYAQFNHVLAPNLATLSDVSTAAPSSPSPALGLADGCGFFNRLCDGGGVGSGCGLFGRLCSDDSSGPFGGCGFFGRLCGGGVGSGCGLFGLLCGGGGPDGGD